MMGWDFVRKGSYNVENQFAINNGKSEEVSLCYGEPGSQSRPGCIGYLRGDFGRSGNEFWSNWFEGHEELKTPEFRQEFDQLINELHDTGPLQNRLAMQRFCSGSGCDQRNDSYHFTIETEDHLYTLRCMQNPGNYNYYCYAYRKDHMQEQQTENFDQEGLNDGFKLDL